MVPAPLCNILLYVVNEENCAALQLIACLPHCVLYGICSLSLSPTIWSCHVKKFAMYSTRDVYLNLSGQRPCNAAKEGGHSDENTYVIFVPATVW